MNRNQSRRIQGWRNSPVTKPMRHLALPITDLPFSLSDWHQLLKAIGISDARLHSRQSLVEATEIGSIVKAKLNNDHGIDLSIEECLVSVLCEIAQTLLMGREVNSFAPILCRLWMIASSGRADFFYSLSREAA